MQPRQTNSMPLGEACTEQEAQPRVTGHSPAGHHLPIPRVAAHDARVIPQHLEALQTVHRLKPVYKLLGLLASAANTERADQTHKKGVRATKAACHMHMAASCRLQYLCPWHLLGAPAPPSAIPRAQRASQRYRRASSVPRQVQPFEHAPSLKSIAQIWSYLARTIGHLVLEHATTSRHRNATGSRHMLSSMQYQ
jgi:hypothetical protein